MQMLSSILPETAVAPGIAQKTSRPATKGAFQKVLKQESGSNNMSEDLPVSHAKATTNTQNTANLPNSGTQQSSTGEKSPVEVKPDGPTDREIVSARTSESALEDLQPSDEGTEPIAESLMAGTILHAPMVQIPTQNTTSPTATGSVMEKSETTVAVAQTNQAIPVIQETQTATASIGKQQPIAPQQNNAPGNEISGDVAQQTSPSEESVNGRSALSHIADTTHQQTGSNQQTAPSPDLEASPATAAQTLSQVTADRIVQVAPSVSGQATNKPVANKAKAQPLGESRFSDLLGQNQTSNSDMVSAEQPTASATQAPVSEPNLVTAPAARNTASLPNNAADKGNKGTETTETVLEIKDQTVSNPSTVIAGTENSQPAITGDPGQTTTIIEVTPGTTESAPGMIQGTEQTAVAGNSPLSSPMSTASAATTDALPSGNGFAIPEQQVMEQVIQRSSLKELEGKRQLTVELHPEELGQVKLNLTQDNDRMQLHLQAHSSEVRDILEKHLPRLQEALQQQGLRLETIQVSVDAQRNNTQEFLDRQQQQAHRNPWQQNHRAAVQTEEQLIAKPTNRANSATGLSLRI
ncbi:flagellar hook-length control protein FliK [Syntrophotalea carbinolica DSM 2380]|uniref:Flagellar hook-length control protein FliK n=1 Tax=Syntrophotalea carbinolica (strain DSM 2380 / NBRC 103641 / GraBd1) TaxID=338963 RepID=Q3A5C2_SYNC1|nr:flagellar hook-length control protein FliK [Syntrophotalea carbinolica]ABA88435.1 flagellar hook-length control protein FliK [Syntrophotalea carbinolica DSM 2380]